MLLAAAQATARRSQIAAPQSRRRMGEPPVRVGPGPGPPGQPGGVVPAGLGETTQAIDGYIEAIGDLEQAPPGVEEAIDPLLRRNPVGGGFPNAVALARKRRSRGTGREAGASRGPNSRGRDLDRRAKANARSAASCAGSLRRGHPAAGIVRDHGLGECSDSHASCPAHRGYRARLDSHCLFLQHRTAAPTTKGASR